jgi:hypothetical protein
MKGNEEMGKITTKSFMGLVMIMGGGCHSQELKETPCLTVTFDDQHIIANMNTSLAAPSDISHRSGTIPTDELMPFVKALLSGEKKQIVADYGNDADHYSIIWTLGTPTTTPAEVNHEEEK